MGSLIMAESLNILGGKLLPCSDSPATGFFRDGCCNTCNEDIGSHTVCVEVTIEFLEYSRFSGNDLSTARPNLAFPGLKEGDRWCLCAGRWLQAYKEGMAPKVFLRNSHIKALELIPLPFLEEFAIQLN
ncbi:MAG: DUF2237 family protein [Candidatus Azotimanducaceae bacterium]